MPKQTGISDSVVGLPKGAGGLESIENNFEVNKQKGTFHFSQPISVPEGRNELTPSLGLTYSSAGGNSTFGLGWSLSPAMFMRDTKFGVPRYRDEDALTWSLAEKLVLMEDKIVDGQRQRLYRPQPDGTYARIQRFTDDVNDYWMVTLTSGIKQCYGQTKQSRVFETAHPERVFQWCLDKVEDTFGNAIVYEYVRDNGEGISTQQTEQHHSYHQLYLAAVRYVEYKTGRKEDFLYHVLFDYGQYADVLPAEALTPESPKVSSTQLVEKASVVDDSWHDRPDPFSTYKAGFEIRTARRCQRILVAVKEAEKPLQITQVYALNYINAAPGTNRISQLQSVQSIGVRKGEKPEVLPAIEFAYSQFKPTAAKFEKVNFHQDQVPPTVLSDPQTTLVDLFGNGLPDLLRATSGSYRYWRNQGGLQFEMAQSMPEHPAVDLSYPGTQLGDMQGNGSADLLVSYPGQQGFYETRFDGTWKQFKPFAYFLSVNLADPQLRLFDTTGDGLVDAVLNTEERFLIYPNKGEFGFEPEPIAIPKLHDLDQFPDVSFSDINRQVRLADMTGDGLQDIILLHGSSVDYWPNLGHGRFGQRIQMIFSPGFTDLIDYSRLHLVDLDGAGNADLVYLGTENITVWCNQQGNKFSEPWTIDGTPFLAPDAIQFADLKGQGGSGILYSYSLSDKICYEFLDLLGEEKPYLLTQVDNNRGALTGIQYRSSTHFYQQAHKKNQSWKTHLPFSTQCVSQLTTKDVFSKGKLAMQFEYHHGHWDGIEREFRGFGHVVQRDTETFEDYNSAMDESFYDLPEAQFSPPVETHHWFHLGAIAHSKDDKPAEMVFDDEFWVEDPQRMQHLNHAHHMPSGLGFDEKREQLNALKGQLIRSEVYALDGSDREHRPYAVTETAHRVTTVDGIHGVYQYGARSTNWERGDEPQTAYTFAIDFDEKYGRPLTNLAIAVPKGKKSNEWDPADRISQPYFITLEEVNYADNPDVYIKDRPASASGFEIKNQTGTIEDVLIAVTSGAVKPTDKVLLSHVNNYYDQLSIPFFGLSIGQLGQHGELVESEQLVFNAEQLATFCQAQGQAFDPSHIPEYLLTQGQSSWPTDAPPEFTQQLAPLAGYRYESMGDPNFHGYYQRSGTKQVDPQTGLLLAERNALDQQTTIEYDAYQLFPVKVTGPIGLSMTLEYDYLIGEVKQATDPNHNLTRFGFTPLGLLAHVAQLGKLGSGVTNRFSNLADTEAKPSVQYTYDHLAYMRSKNKPVPEPITVRTLTRKHHIHHHDGMDTLVREGFDEFNEYPGHFIEEVAFQDGFGRLLQARKRIDADIYYDPANPDGDPKFLTDDLSKVNDRDSLINARLRRDDYPAGNRAQREGYAFVGGLKRYNNKGKVVVNYGAYYEQGDDQHDCMTYRSPQAAVEASLVTVQHFYDAVGRAYKVVSDDGSMALTVYGRVDNPTNPAVQGDDIQFIPTPWHRTVYDQNDNAGRTHPSMGDHQHHYNTPVIVELDALGRQTKETKYLRRAPIAGEALGAIEPIHTTFIYDIKGNVLTITDGLSRASFRYAYDNLNQVWRSWNIDSGLKRVVFDVLGSPIEMCNARGAAVFSAFDDGTRPTFIWAKDHAAAQVTLRQVIIYGDQTSLTDAERLAANLNGEVYEHFDDARHTTVEQYDVKGNPLKEKHRMVKPSRYVEHHAQSGDVAIDWAVSWQNGPGALVDPELSHEVGTHYDALDNPVRIELPNNIDSASAPVRVMVYQYNYTHGVVSRMQLDDQLILNAAVFSANGQPVLFKQGGQVSKYFAYNDETLLLSRMLARRSDGEVFQNTQYRHDLSGNIVEVKEHRPNAGLYDTQTQQVSDTLTRKFSYDSLYRLNSATGREMPRGLGEGWEQFARNPRTANGSLDFSQVKPYTRHYHQDEVENLIRMQREQAQVAQPSLFYNPQVASNQLAIVAEKDSPPPPTEGREYRYDDAGNMTHEDGDKRRFTWDYANRLVRFEDASGVTHYVYDVGGQRTHKIRVRSAAELDVTIYFSPWFEYSYTATLDASYDVVATSSKSDRLHVNNGIHRIAILTKTAAEDVTLFCLTDHLGNIVRGLTVDAQGLAQPAFETEYYPYGQVSLGASEDYPYGFTGKERDAESGLYYYGARYYASHLGRWISVDPAGASEGVNGYQFCGNDPVNHVDLHGFASKKVGGGSFPDWLKKRFKKARDFEGKVRAGVNLPNQASEVWFGRIGRADIIGDYDIVEAKRFFSVKAKNISSVIRRASVQQIGKYIFYLERIVGKGNFNHIGRTLVLGVAKKDLTTFLKNLNTPEVREALEVASKSGVNVAFTTVEKINLKLIAKSSLNTVGHAARGMSRAARDGVGKFAKSIPYVAHAVTVGTLSYSAITNGVQSKAFKEDLGGAAGSAAGVGLALLFCWNPASCVGGALLFGFVGDQAGRNITSVNIEGNGKQASSKESQIKLRPSGGRMVLQ